MGVVLALWLSALAPEQRVVLLVDRARVSTCPDDATLRARVTERLRADPFLDEGDASRTLLVELTAKRRAIGARITLVNADGSVRGTRALSGPKDCVQLADQLVLAMAIAIDPLVLTRDDDVVELPEHPPHDDDSGMAFTAPPVLAPSTGSTRSAPPRRNGNDVVREAEIDAIELHDADEDITRHLPGHLAARGVLGTRISDATLPTIAGAMELSFDVRPFGVDVGFVGALPATATGEVTADRALLAILVAPCARATWIPLAFSGCALGEIGVLAPDRGAPEDPLLWAAPGVRGAFALALSSRLGVRLSADALIPLSRRRILEAGDSLWTAPLVAGQVAIAVEVQIW